MLRIGKNVRCIAAFNNIAAQHDNCAVGNFGHHAHIMRDEQYCHAFLFLQIPDEFEDLGLDGDIERGGGLVGNQEFWLAASAIAIITRCRIPPESRCG